jgi:hypothetical protein
MIQQKTYFTGTTLENLATVSQMMVDLQNKQNVIVNPLWHMADYPFMRAAWTEASEAMNHTTWEWWKNLDNNYYDAFREEKDIAEFHMELVDCLHFLISAHMQGYMREERVGVFAMSNAAQGLLGMLDKGYEQHVDDSWVEYFAPIPAADVQGRVDLLSSPEMTLRRVESLVAACLNNDLRLAFGLLVEVAEHTELGLVGLIGRYFAKATLNQHRWANGYKEKTYIKSWGGGKEDNTYLNEIVIGQLEGMPLDTLLETLADGTWQAELAEDLNDLYDNVKQTGHAHHRAAQAVSPS